MTLAPDIKQQLVAKCYEYIAARMANAQEAMNHAQEAANAEGKSSMGDKYETGRAMAQLEKEKALGQLNEALKMRAVLDQFKSTGPMDRVVPGSLVVTKELAIFLSIGAGKLTVAGTEFLVVAPASPLGNNVLKLKAGDSFTFNKQVQVIDRIL